MFLLNFTHLAVAVLAFFVSKQDSTTRRFLLGRRTKPGNSNSNNNRETSSPAPRLGGSVATTSASISTSTGGNSLLSGSSASTSTSSSSSLLRSTSTSLHMQAADTIASGAIHAATHAFRAAKPITVTVVDAQGHVLIQKRMNDCPPGAYPQFSLVKARTCVHLQTSSRNFRQKYLETSSSTTSNHAATDPSSMMSLPASASSSNPAQFTQASTMVSVTQGDLLPVAGGILLQDCETGQTIGAVGVSGAAADEDEYCALAGVEALRQYEQHQRQYTDQQQHEEASHAPFLLRTVPAHNSCKTVVSARPAATVVP